MKRTHAVGAAALAALTALALAACGSDDNSGDTPSSAAPTSGESTAAMETTPAVTLSGTLNGGGSSAQSKAQEAWVAGFQTANSGATVNYTVSDSGAGRKGFLDSSLDFAGSDGALSTDELTSSKDRCYGGSGIDLPNYVSPIAIAFNIPGVTSLNLKPDTIAKIFNGTITTWDDPAITADNSGASLSGPITVVHRSDDSGTTKNFTDTLKQLAPDVWTYDVTNDMPLGQGCLLTAESRRVPAGGTWKSSSIYIYCLDPDQWRYLSGSQVEVSVEYVDDANRMRQVTAQAVVPNRSAP